MTPIRLEEFGESSMSRQSLRERYLTTRARSLELCAPLQPEDYRVQSMTAVSPPWWNLGHTTWFFAKNILEPYAEYGSGDSKLEFVLNSYYTALGPRIAQGDRGKMSRPATQEVRDFRESVDRRVADLIAQCSDEDFERIRFLIITGLQHEQQHQELLLSEVKHIYWTHPPVLRPVYTPGTEASASVPPEADWVPFEGGLCEFGNREGGWCWDNELPVHKAYLEDFSLANRLVTNGEYLDFIEDGGYSEPLLWLSNGFATLEQEGWEAPLYWERADGGWSVWTLSGPRELDPHEPVCHISFYEADAFARWKSRTFQAWEGARLPREREWEQAARVADFCPEAGNFADRGIFHPRPAAAQWTPGPTDGESAGGARLEDVAAAGSSPALLQTAGDVWEWTSSHYEAYPGFQPFPGSLQEYNGKFMDNQRVLRGGSCATPESHIRVSYRNFWAPETRFQFTGLRLAKLTGS